MKDVKICGMALTRASKQKPEIISAITWLDIKISEFMIKLEDLRYVHSNNVIADASEIMGVLKFLQMAGIITKEESKSILRYISD